MLLCHRMLCSKSLLQDKPKTRAKQRSDLLRPRIYFVVVVYFCHFLRLDLSFAVSGFSVSVLVSSLRGGLLFLVWGQWDGDI